MDKATVFGTVDGSSILSRGTNKKESLPMWGFFFVIYSEKGIERGKGPENTLFSV